MSLIALVGKKLSRYSLDSPIRAELGNAVVQDIVSEWAIQYLYRAQIFQARGTRVTRVMRCDVTMDRQAWIYHALGVFPCKRTERSIPERNMCRIPKYRLRDRVKSVPELKIAQIAEDTGESVEKWSRIASRTR
jgi:hypothetical protein